MATISIQKFQSYWRSLYKGDMEIPFSERLLSFLCYHTDVGQIPRGNARSLSPASSHCNAINWRKAITGCYWCSNANTSCQGICCSPLCLLYFHEWCVLKVNKTTQSAICLLPGCEEEKVDKCYNVCSEKHNKEYTEKYYIISQSNDISITSPKWYIDRTKQMPHLLSTTDSRISHTIISKNDIIVETTGNRPVIDEFESMVSQVQNKMNTYFSQLIKTLMSRQDELNSELDEILTNYRQQREKIKELKKLNKLHTKMYSRSTVKEVLDDVTVRVETELSCLKENIPICVEFEWDRRYAKKASKLGTLTHSVSPKPNPSPTRISIASILFPQETQKIQPLPQYYPIPRLSFPPTYNTFKTFTPRMI